MSNNSNITCITESPLATTTIHPLVIELNNTSIFYQIHRRATHSKEAFEAFLYIAGLSGIVIISVLWSKMWREKTYLAVNNQQPIQYTQNGPEDEILVKGNFESN